MAATTLTNGLATRFDWVAEKDELIVLQVPVIDSNRDPFDVTGWIVDAKVETRSVGGIVLYGFPVSLASGTDVFLTIPAATSAAWTFSTARYQLSVQHPTDATQIHRILQGRFFVR